ncbi:radical SAM protein [Desulfovibrio sp. ZJ200]|uniref:radical SAM/SPASM domain-containing protein n=1 Tax=Desulfovibrio sp. ZJ200 TaxID=2709792 RepID=UPI0013EA4CC2|nr:radical SAM protein [Desulfovibrio sp. ZJ200]
MENINYKIADKIISFERNGQTLITSGININPILVTNEDANKIKKYIEEIRKYRNISLAIDHAGHEDLFMYLMDRKIIIPDNNNLKKTHKQNMKGASIFLLLTQYCNLNCIYCLNGKESYRKNDELKMNLDVAITAIRKFIEIYKECDDLEIVFFGGEPLLNWSLIKDIIKYSEKNFKPSMPGLRYHITTNLTIFPDDIIYWAKKYNITFLVDIDGDEITHNKLRPSHKINSFKSTTNHLSLLRLANIPYSLRTTVTSFNVNQMVGISLLHKELGGDSSAFVAVGPINSDNFIMPPSWYPDIDIFEDNLINILNENIWKPRELFPVKNVMEIIENGSPLYHGCGSPFNKTSAICVNGDAYACIYFVGNKKFYLGNVMSDEYPNNDVLQIMQEESHVDNLSKCMSCNYKYMCGGGCPLSKFMAEENKNATNELVEYSFRRNCFSKKVFEYLMWKIADASCV